MNTVKPETITNVPPKITQAQIDQEAGIRMEIKRRVERFTPYIGREFTKPGDLQHMTYTITEFHPAVPLGGVARPTFTVSRSPFPGAWHIDAEEFLRDYVETLRPTNASDAAIPEAPAN